MLQVVRDVAQQTGPFSSVSLDASRTDASLAEEVAARFRAQAERLAGHRATVQEVEALRGPATSPPGRGGPAHLGETAGDTAAAGRSGRA